MKTAKSFLVLAAFCMQIAFASSANSAEAVQLSASTPNSPLIYVIYVTSEGQIPQQPYQIPIGSLFVGVQTATQKNGKNGGVSYSFSHLDKFGNSTVTSYRIEWVKDGVVRDSRTLQQWPETGANWYFSVTQKLGKNTELIREGMVNDIIGSSTGGTRAMFNHQYFTIDGPGTYEVRIWATVGGAAVSRQIILQVPAWYESVQF
jgi:hypothetical protein